MKRKKLPFTLMLAALSSFAGDGQAFADQRTWTLDADFDEGTIVNLNHDIPFHDQLQLNNFAQPFRFINVAASARGTVVRIDTDTGEIVGEYYTAPTRPGVLYNPSPSRTTVDIRGNVWTANRAEGDENGDDRGSAVKIGIVVGGTRCNKNADGSITANPQGDYVWLDPSKPTYNTCVDRDKDGLIRTSRTLGNILSWPDNGDGQGGAGGGDAQVQDAVDECILIYQRLPDAPGARHVSVDRENNVWVAGHPYKPKMFYKLDENTGAIIDKFDARVFGCGGYGGTIVNNNFDQILGNDVLWSASLYQHQLLRYDLSTKTGQCIPALYSYGLGIDNDGFIWNNLSSQNTITKINPNTGDYVSGFPVPTGGEFGRGIAVSADNTVWSANSVSNTVTRLNPNGSLRARIDLAAHNPAGLHPTGVAVDKAGKVWVTNRESNNAMRIDPATNQVDLTVDLGGAEAIGGPAGSYTYSDMTGILRLGHPPIGFWDVVYNGGCGTLWNRISWSSDENPATNSAITVEVRAAATKEGLAAVPFQTVTNGADLSGMRGQFMEVRASFISEAPVGQRDLPVLKDLTLEHHPLTMTVNIPDQKYSFGFPPFDLDDYISFNPAGNWFNDVVWSHSSVPDGWSVSIDDNHVATVAGPPNETNGPPSETRDMPITFSARLPWDGETCGAVSDTPIFFPNHPPAMCDAAAFKCVPKNNKQWFSVPLTGFVCDPDGDAVTVRITSITSDEIVGDEEDASGIGTDTAIVRQERDAHGDGRVYLITFVASDGRGGETTMTLPARVPHDLRGDKCEAADSGPRYDATKPSEEEGKGGKGKKK